MDLKTVLSVDAANSAPSAVSTATVIKSESGSISSVTLDAVADTDTKGAIIPHITCSTCKICVHVECHVELGGSPEDARDSKYQCINYGVL